MEHCCHSIPLPTCGISSATTASTETKAETTTKTKANKVQQRYESLQHLVDNRGQFVLNKTNSKKNCDIIPYAPRGIQSNIKKKKKQIVTTSVLQLHQGSLFKKKLSDFSSRRQQQLYYLRQRTRERREFLAWHLLTKAI